VTSSEEKIRSVLVRTVPLPAGAGRDWEDVLSRSAASTRIVHTRRLVYSVAFAAVVAIVLAATPLGAVIARGFGDFSGWLSGSAGHPASSTAQRAFAQEKQRSWVYRLSWPRFAKTPALRSLITVTRDGVHYELFGYRVGDSFCLRLVASGVAKSTSTHQNHTNCAPRSELVAGTTPVLPVHVDAGIVGRQRAPGRNISVTFGITSDGVAAVRARTKTSELEGIVGGDSFLIINLFAVGPNAAARARIRSITAVDASGDEVAIPFFDWSTRIGETRPPKGPSKVERPVEHVRIAWIARRESRGVAVPLSRFRERWHSPKQRTTFARLLTPVQGGRERVMVRLNRDGDIRFSLVLGRTECSAGGSFKDLARSSYPFILMESGGNQYMTILGLADDEVARMTLFLATGERVAVPLKDNAYVVKASLTKFPVRVVAYDRDNRVIGIAAMADLRSEFENIPPVKGATWRPLFHVRSPGGETSTLSVARSSVARSTAGGLCWRVTPVRPTAPYGIRRGSPPFCLDRYWYAYQAPISLRIDVVGKSTFVYGPVEPNIARVAFHLANGKVVSVTPRRGYVLMATVAPTKARQRPVRMIVGFDKNGKEVGTEDLKEWVSPDVLARKYHLPPVRKGQVSK
jgi:hypothetical protein